MYEVSVIICAYTEKRWHDLCAAVASLLRQTLPATEIIVVIDHNPTLLQLARAHLSGITLIENTQKRGLRGARSSGVLATHGEILAFLDDDAIAEPDWLEQLCAGYVDLNVLGTGGFIAPLWSTKKPAWFPEEFYWIIGCTYKGMPQEESPIRNPIGANMSFRRESFETIGTFRCDGFDLAHQHAGGCEETEFCIRALQYWPQRHILYLPKARILHRVSCSRTHLRYIYKRCYAEGLSKAVIASTVGRHASLASEYPYVLHTLTKGIVHNLVQATLHKDIYALARTWIMVSGLFVTILGYIVGSILLNLSFRRGGKDAKAR